MPKKNVVVEKAVEIKERSVQKMSHLRENGKEIGKDLKGIGAGLIKTGASAFCLVKDTLRVPLSVCKDIRDGVKKPLENQEDQKVEEPKQEVILCEASS